MLFKIAPQIILRDAKMLANSVCLYFIGIIYIVLDILQNI